MLQRVFFLWPWTWGSLVAAAMLLASCQYSQSSLEAHSGADQPNPAGQAEQSAQPDQKTTPKQGTTANPTVTQTSDPYINRLLPQAKRIRQEYGIPLDLTLSIAIHETGYGKHVIGENNHFGLKCRTNDCVTLRGRRGTSQWENCSEPDYCFDTFAQTIQDLSDGNFRDLKEIRREGYAMSPKWTQKVRKIRRSVRRQLRQARTSS